MRLGTRISLIVVIMLAGCGVSRKEAINHLEIARNHIKWAQAFPLTSFGTDNLKNADLEIKKALEKLR